LLIIKKENQMKGIKMMGFFCLTITGCLGEKAQLTEKSKISIETD